MTTPRLLRNGLTEQIYIVTRYTQKVAPNGTPYIVAHQKYPVTDEELAAIGLEKLPRIKEGS
jgi:uncharacterized protein YwqG